MKHKKAHADKGKEQSFFTGSGSRLKKRKDIKKEIKRDIKKEIKEKPAYRGFYNLYAKRALDIAVSGSVIILTWPLYLVIGIAIASEDGLPVFYRAERGGYLGKPFKICKFRTMVKNADQIGGGTTAHHDPRITHVGRVLRKTKLDEIPQFLQVFTGQMSIIGPRPELLQYTEQYTEEEQIILKVRPGISDYSSLKFINLDEIVGSEDADEVYEQKVLHEKNRLRVQYAKDVSFVTDCRIFAMTAVKVVNKAGNYLLLKRYKL